MALDRAKALEMAGGHGLSHCPGGQHTIELQSGEVVLRWILEDLWWWDEHHPANPVKIRDEGHLDRMMDDPSLEPRY